MGNMKVAALSVSAVVLVAVLATVAVTMSNHHPEPAKTQLSSSQKNIKDFCHPTDYPETCESTLSAAAGNSTDPKELVNLAFQITIDKINEAFNHSTVLSEAAKDPRTSDALENCRELLDYAIDDLRGSIDRLDGFSLIKLDKFLDDLKVWISATITYQETCLDGFENTTTNAAESMRKALNSSAEMTSNVLAIVTNLDNTLDSLNLGISRKLLAEEYPSWVSLGKRRLLQLSPAELKPSVTVAQDGTGDVKTINDALLRVPKKSNDTFVIYIKEGVYKEKVQVNRSLTNVIMVGDGTNKTKITGSLNYIDGTATFKTATVAVIGDGFIGKDLWIENSAGAAKHQAVALRVQSDKSEKLPTFLGRPWKEFSRTFVLQSQLDDLIDPKGWLPWFENFGLNTCFYTELDNRGPGANTSQRVKWKGVKIIDYAHAQKFTVEHFIQGNAWLPKTGVPYIPGLLPMSEAGRIH
ncbi:pectinesterase [Musa troglodytarum]|uniref:Pectinesterase n=2 Tax=Musa troglodytarum TaxID=320322 RepID=A0A9E7FXU4_9LILI|nr:pectinesterase [Musa troglodytarum]